MLIITPGLFTFGEEPLVPPEEEARWDEVSS